MTFSHAVRYLQESDVPFCRCMKVVLSQEMRNVRKYGVFSDQIGLEVFLCSLDQPACCELLCHQLKIKDRRYLHLSSSVFAMSNGAAPTLRQDPTVSRAVRDKHAIPAAGLRSNSPLKRSIGRLDCRDFGILCLPLMQAIHVRDSRLETTNP